MHHLDKLTRTQPVSRKKIKNRYICLSIMYAQKVSTKKNIKGDLLEKKQKKKKTTRRVPLANGWHKANLKQWNPCSSNQTKPIKRTPMMKAKKKKGEKSNGTPSSCCPGSFFCALALVLCVQTLYCATNVYEYISLKELPSRAPLKSSW